MGGAGAWLPSHGLEVGGRKWDTSNNFYIFFDHSFFFFFFVRIFYDYPILFINFLPTRLGEYREISSKPALFSPTRRHLHLDWEQACFTRWDATSPHPNPCPASCPACRHVSASCKSKFNRAFDDESCARFGIPLSYIAQYR